MKHWVPALAALAFLSLGATAWLALDWAPVAQDSAGGLTQKIFYFHVPSAYVMYLGVFACVLGSLGYLAQRRPGWDALAQAGGELAVLFSAIVLISGPLWGRKAWGVFWVWDPRLTTTLLGSLLFVAYLVLRSSAGAGEAEKRFSAALAILGAAVMPVIHYSVQLWRGQHPTVITSRGGGLAPEMGMTLGVAFAAFTLAAVVLLVVRASLCLAQARLETARTDAIALGLLEESE
ncbi:MAG: cytochrome c biogenesis protein CcsA [Deltaproteobacteria bacterium]|nr:cytochrome c biogenesis protein CcsA [Deltaproteobacteria bacterium]